MHNALKTNINYYNFKIIIASKYFIIDLTYYTYYLELYYYLFIVYGIYLDT